MISRNGSWAALYVTVTIILGGLAYSGDSDPHSVTSESANLWEVKAQVVSDPDKVEFVTDSPGAVNGMADVNMAAVFASTLSSDCEYTTSQTGQTQATLTISNAGNATLSGNLSVSDFPGAATLSIPGIGAYSILAGGADIVKTVTMAANGAAEGLYVGSITITHNGATPGNPSPKVYPIQFFVFNDYYCPQDEILKTGVASPGSLALQVESGGRLGSGNPQGGLWRHSDSSSSLYEASLLLAHGNQSADTVVFHRFFYRPSNGQAGFHADGDLQVDTSAYGTGSGYACASATMLTRDSLVAIDVNWLFPQAPSLDDIVLTKYTIRRNRPATNVSNLAIGLIADLDAMPATRLGGIQNVATNQPGGDAPRRLVWARGVDTVGHVVSGTNTATRFRGGVAVSGSATWGGFEGAIVGNNADDLFPGGGPTDGFLYQELMQSAGIDLYSDSDTDLYALVTLDRGVSLAAGQDLEYVMVWASDTLSEASFKSKIDAGLALVATSFPSCANLSCYANTDINGDGIHFTPADLLYLTEFVNFDGPAPLPLSRADLNDDGFIDYGDVEIFQSYFTYGISVFPQYPIPVGCDPDTVRGACCEGPTCHIRSETNCNLKDGLYYGPATQCSTITCIGPLGCADEENLIENAGFVQGAVPGVMPSPGQAANWSRAYGAPVVVADSGCEDLNYVELNGNKSSGSAIHQVLSTPIQKGHVYELQMCVRVAGSPMEYANLRTIAFNGSLPTTGVHPFKHFVFPDLNIAVMDVSGRIQSCDDEWTTYITQRWKAYADFTSIAINVENNEPAQLSYVDIDNICLHEVSDSIPCYLIGMDPLTHAIIYPDSLDCPPLAEDSIDLFMGSVSDLYEPCGAGDGGDLWYGNCPDSCASIGGTIPEEILNFNLTDSLQDSLPEYGLPADWNVLLDSLDAIEDSLIRIQWSPFDTLKSLGAIPPLCDSLARYIAPPGPSTSPFNGRDIVFVHGFRLTPECDRLSDNVPGAKTKWGALNRDEFINNWGYWKAGANAYWNEHILQYLGYDAEGNGPGIPGNPNRFLVAAHPATQVGVVGAHAVLWQIREAMRNGTGVHGPNQSYKFGEKGFVIISHSCGALISNVAMSLANSTKVTLTSPPRNIGLRLILGPLDDISDHCQLHVALNGAFTGSNYAVLQELALIAGIIPPDLTRKLVFSLMCESDPPASIDLDARLDVIFSQLIDMAIPRYIYGDDSPQLLQELWGTPMKDVPMKVLTVTGGHPSEYGISEPDVTRQMWKQILGKHIVNHGFDDGVVSIDGQSANSDARLAYPNKYLAKPGLLTWVANGTLASTGGAHFAGLLNERVYDMGIRPRRAIGYYLDQKLDVLVSSTLRWIVASGPSPCTDLGFTECNWTAAVSIPWLSPTGMMQPVEQAFIPLEPGYDALKRQSPEHFSFIQGASDHFGGSTELDGPTNPDPGFECYFNSQADQSHTGPNPVGDLNYEEVRVLNPILYSLDIVSDDMKSMQKEVRRGKKIQPCIKFRLFGKTHRWCTPPLWIWKRQYHFLRDNNAGECGDHQLHYVYQYVLKP